MMLEVFECYYLIGEFDYLFKVVCSNYCEFEVFLVEWLMLMFGVDCICMSIVLCEEKSMMVLLLSEFVFLDL